MGTDNGKSERALDRIAAGVRHPAVEHVLNVVKALLANFPVGAAIASLMTDYIPKRQTQRLEEFAKRVAEDIAGRQERVDAEFVKTDEFAYLFEECFRGVARNYQQEKIEAFRGILVNSLISREAGQAEREFFLGLVQTLTVLHIQIMRLMAQPERLQVPAPPRKGSQLKGLGASIEAVLPNVSGEAILAAFDDLVRRQLLVTDVLAFGGVPDFHILGKHNTRLSDLGRRFVDFCTVGDDRD